MVRNDEELRINAHFSTKTRESSLICFIERGVDFVEQTEGGGVELKHGKDERRGRERLFAARQKPHGLIALAGRLSRNFNTRREDLVALHAKRRAASAEKTAERVIKLFVDLVKGFTHACAGLCVNAADSRLERLNGLPQILHLSFCEANGFLRRLKMGQSCMIDRTECGNFIHQARDLVTHRVGLDASFLRELRELGPIRTKFLHAPGELPEQSRLLFGLYAQPSNFFCQRKN